MASLTPVEELFAGTPVHNSAPSRTPRRRGFGIASAVLAAVAIAGDLAVIALGAIAMGTLSDTVTDADSTFGWTLGAVFAIILAFWGGLILSVLSIVFGIIAVARRRGRTLGAVGLTLAIAVVVVHITLGVQLIAGIDQLARLSGLV